MDTIILGCYAHTHCFICLTMSWVPNKKVPHHKVCNIAFSSVAVWWSHQLTPNDCIMFDHLACFINYLAWCLIGHPNKDMSLYQYCWLLGLSSILVVIQQPLCGPVHLPARQFISLIMDLLRRVFHDFHWWLATMQWSSTETLLSVEGHDN